MDGQPGIPLSEAFSRPEHFRGVPADYKNLEELKQFLRRGGLGDVEVKKFLNNVMQAHLTPNRRVAEKSVSKIPDVYDILKAGS